MSLAELALRAAVLAQCALVGTGADAGQVRDIIAHGIGGAVQVDGGWLTAVRDGVEIRLSLAELGLSEPMAEEGDTLDVDGLDTDELDEDGLDTDWLADDGGIDVDRG